MGQCEKVVSNSFYMTVGDVTHSLYRCIICFHLCVKNNNIFSDEIYEYEMSALESHWPIYSIAFPRYVQDK